MEGTLLANSAEKSPETVTVPSGPPVPLSPWPLKENEPATRSLDDEVIVRVPLVDDTNEPEWGWPHR